MIYILVQRFNFFSFLLINRWDLLLAPSASSGVSWVGVKQQQLTGEACVDRRCVWCSFAAAAMETASGWEWSKARGSAWWIWRRLTPPCLRRSESCWSWETQVWSVRRGTKHFLSLTSSRHLRRHSNHNPAVLSEPWCQVSVWWTDQPSSYCLLFWPQRRWCVWVWTTRTTAWSKTPPSQKNRSSSASFPAPSRARMTTLLCLQRARWEETDRK